MQNAHGETALHFAAAFGRLTAVSWLLDNGAHVNHKSTGGATPLHMAATQGHLTVLKLLVERGADVQARTARGATAMHISARDGRLEVVKWLYNLGCDVSAQTHEGKTPLQYASEQEATAVVHFLEGVSKSVTLEDEGRDDAGAETAATTPGADVPGTPAGRDPPTAAADGAGGAGGVDDDPGIVKPKSLERIKIPTPAAKTPGSAPAAGPMPMAPPRMVGRGSIIQGDQMRPYLSSMSAGNYYLAGSYLCPPFEAQGLLRVYEPGTSMFLPWPQRYCVLCKNVLFVFKFWDMKEMVTSVHVEGTLIESGATRTGTMHSFVVCKMRPLAEGGGPMFEEFFATDSYYETEGWIAALRNCQRNNMKVYLKKADDDMGSFSTENAMNEIEDMENTYSDMKNQLIALANSRKPMEEKLRSLRTAYDLETSSGDAIPAEIRDREAETAAISNDIQRLQMRLKGTHNKTKALMREMEVAATKSEQALAEQEQQTQGDPAFQQQQQAYGGGGMGMPGGGMPQNYMMVHQNSFPNNFDPSAMGMMPNGMPQSAASMSQGASTAPSMQGQGSQKFSSLYISEGTSDRVIGEILFNGDADTVDKIRQAISMDCGVPPGFTMSINGTLFPPGSQGHELASRFLNPSFPFVLINPAM